MANRITRGKGLFGTLGVSGASALGVITGTSLNLGSATLQDIVFGTLNAVHGTILPGGIGTVTAALAGLAAADAVVANVLTPTAGLVLSGVKPGVGTLTAYFVNPGLGTIAPGTFALTYAHVDLT